MRQNLPGKICRARHFLPVTRGLAVSTGVLNKKAGGCPPAPLDPYGDCWSDGGDGGRISRPGRLNRLLLRRQTFHDRPSLLPGHFHGPGDLRRIQGGLFFIRGRPQHPQKARDNG